jgi:hypothetical protein
MQVQKGSWKVLKQQLPCVACLAGHMRKTNKMPLHNYSDFANLAVTWTSNTEVKIVAPRSNEDVAVDWAIINKRLLPNKNNVFVVYLDVNTGLVFTYPAPSRGAAGPSLLAYIQQYGRLKQITHNNAKEFCHGDFGDICLQRSITPKPTPPFDHNKTQLKDTSRFLLTRHAHFLPSPASTQRILGACACPCDLHTEQNSISRQNDTL